MKSEYTDEECQFLINNYGKIPLKYITEYLGRTSSQVCSKAKKLGLVGTGPGKQRRLYDYDNTIFQFQNLDSCYWAGVLAADGNIYAKQQGVKLHLGDDRFRTY
jgi:hypothetical protein